MTYWRLETKLAARVAFRAARDMAARCKNWRLARIMAKFGGAPSDINITIAVGRHRCHPERVLQRGWEHVLYWEHLLYESNEWDARA